MIRPNSPLLRRLNALSPQQVAEVESFVRQLCEQAGLPEEGDALDLGSLAADDLLATHDSLGVQESMSGDIDDGQDGHQAVARQAGNLPPPLPEERDELWIDWLRRPFDGVCHDDMQPIARLYRDAVGQRAMNRMRFGAVC